MIKKGLLILLCMPMIGFGQGWKKYFVSDYSSALSVKQTKPIANQPLFYIYDDGTVEKRIIIE